MPNAEGERESLRDRQCRQNTLYPLSGMQASVEKLTRIYAKAGLPERFRGTF